MNVQGKKQTGGNVGWESCGAFAPMGFGKYSLQTGQEPQRKLIAHPYTPRPPPTLCPSLNSLHPPLLPDSSSRSRIKVASSRKPSEPQTGRGGDWCQCHLCAGRFGSKVKRTPGRCRGDLQSVGWGAGSPLSPASPTGGQPLPPGPLLSPSPPGRSAMQSPAFPRSGQTLVLFSCSSLVLPLVAQGP